MDLILFGLFLCLAWGVFAAVFKARARAKRKRQLFEKYGDVDIVNRIIDKVLHDGDEQEIVRDMLGEPVAVDERVYKSKVKQTWKYAPTGKNQYALRVIVENGTVVGWKVQGG